MGLILAVTLCLGACGAREDREANDAREPTAGAREHLSPQRPGIDEGKAYLTGYYIAEVTTDAEPGEGVAVHITYLDGGTAVRHFPEEVVRVAEMEAVATRTDEHGVRRVAVRLGPNKWKEIPSDQFGIGSKNNPLAPWVHVAADQELYPYGSRIFMPDAVGHETVDGRIHDGYAWVADVGGMIKGPLRFDLFVGHADVYWKTLARSPDKKPDTHVVVDRLPDPPDGLDPWQTAEVRRILLGLGYTIDDAPGLSPSLEAAIIEFQKRHEQVPEVEYGNHRAAVTLWFLTQAAHKVAGQNAEKGEER